MYLCASHDRRLCPCVERRPLTRFTRFFFLTNFLRYLRFKILKIFPHNLVLLPRDASAERGNATVSRLSVCLSVRLSVRDV